jgi:hypothetical protein
MQNKEYIEQRLISARTMMATATGACARLAYLEMARRYEILLKEMCAVPAVAVSALLPAVGKMLPSEVRHRKPVALHA